MGKKNRQIHLVLETEVHAKLKKEAEQNKISLNELIRRKLEDLPTREEIIILRKLENIFSGGVNANVS